MYAPCFDGVMPTTQSRSTGTSGEEKYPTLTVAERDQVLDLEAHLEDLEAQRTALTEQMSALRERRRSVFESAARRDVTPEQVALTYRTTGQGQSDLNAIIRDLHPYFGDVAHFGARWAGTPTLTTTLYLTGTRNDPAQIPALTTALVDLLALVAPDGGLAFDPASTPSHEIDWTWHEHANGMHPVDILEDDLSEHRSLLLAVTSDGTRAVLMDRQKWWQYPRDGIVATGTLTEVLERLFHEVRDNQPRRDDEDGD